MSNQSERLEVAMLCLSFLSFGAGLTLTAIAAYYGSIFMALMAIFSFMVGVLFYFIYREPALSEDVNSSDEMKKRDATRETVFLISLLLIAMFSYADPGFPQVAAMVASLGIHTRTLLTTLTQAMTVT